MNQNTPLREFYEKQFKPKRLRKATAIACRVYLMAVEQFNRFLGRGGTLADLNDVNLTSFARAVIEFGIPHKTVLRRRQALSAIRRFAARSRSQSEPGGDLDVTLLRDFIDTYVEKRNAERPIGKEIKPRSRQNLQETVQVFSSWLARPATMSDLVPTTINRFLSEYLAAGLSPYTVKHKRTILVLLLRRAVRLGLAFSDPKDVRSVHRSSLKIDGYDKGEMEQLIEVCATLTGVLPKTGLPKSIYFASALLTLWDLGCRLGDLSEIEVQDFDKRGCFHVQEQKTGKVRTRMLHSSTSGLIAALIAIDPDRRKIWPGLTGRGSWSRRILQIARAAGLPGSAKWIRRGAASMVESQRSGSAWRFLNHSVPTLFERHYRVERIVDPDPISPGEIDIPASISEANHPRVPKIDPVEYRRQRDLNNTHVRRCRERKGGAA